MNNGVNNNTNQTNPSGVPQTTARQANYNTVLTPHTQTTQPQPTQTIYQQQVQTQPSQVMYQAQQTQMPTPQQQQTTTSTIAPIATENTKNQANLQNEPNVQIENQTTSKTEPKIKDKTKKEKKKIDITPFLLIIILILGAYTIYSSKTHKTQIENLTYNCTAVTASKEETKLDLESTLVKDLYSKVYTNIREDLAQPTFNNNLKLYLAYRQVLEKDKYDSNCNLYNSQAMEPFKCEVSTAFVPKAFKKDTLIEEYKKLFGEKTNIQLENIQLGSSCIGGYQYIESRDEFVQGYCSKNTATSYKVTKKLLEATSTRNTIILKEEVKYHENEGMSLPSYLKSGYYYYTFRLDLNYNYVIVSREYQSKY